MMERYFSIFRLGIRYLYRHRRRYYFLMAALIFGFAIVTFITAIKDGMYDSVYYSAQSHYAGDIVAVGYDTDTSWSFCRHLGHNEIQAIVDAAELSGINPRHTVLRTYSSTGLTVHYNGGAVPLRSLVGCDWDGETHLFEKMTFDELDVLAGDDGIALSAPIARQLGAKAGDLVTLEADTRYRQKNTGMFVVKGIIQDTSIFSYYKAYISRLSMNRLLGFEDNDCSTVGFFLDNPAAAERERVRLQGILAERVQTGPLVYGRDEMDRERDRPWEGTRVFLYTLPVYLSEASFLLDAMNIITYFLYGMMLLTILVSAAVTYRLILYERSREMGIMRVIGFYGSDLRLVLWAEIIILGLISMAAGFMLAMLLAWAASCMSFSWFPGFEIFLRGGRLTAVYLPLTMLKNAALMLLVLITLALFPSFRVSRKSLSGLLSGEPL